MGRTRTSVAFVVSPRSIRCFILSSSDRRIFRRTLDPSDRQKLDEMDRRAADATAQMQLDDTATFQACLESRRQEDRALILLRGVQRETDRLNRRAALKRALDKS